MAAPAMLRRLALLALLAFGGPAPVAVAPPSPPPPPPVTALLPEPLPARYLRTLAHDPGGYDPTCADGVIDLLLGDILFHSPHILGPEARRAGLSCQVCHPNGATNATLVIAGLSDRPGNVDS